MTHAIHIRLISLSTFTFRLKFWKCVLINLLYALAASKIAKNNFLSHIDPCTNSCCWYRNISMSSSEWNKSEMRNAKNVSWNRILTCYIRWQMNRIFRLVWLPPLNVYRKQRERQKTNKNRRKEIINNFFSGSRLHVLTSIVNDWCTQTHTSWCVA